MTRGIRHGHKPLTKPSPYYGSTVSPIPLREGITTRNAAYVTRITPSEDVVVELSQITANCINCCWVPYKGKWRLKYKSSICRMHGKIECIALGG